jgi:cytochrome c biogenesis protein CcdA
MLRVIGLVVSIGLADCLNPTTIGPALYLASGDRPRRAVIQFTLGFAAVFMLGGVLVAVGPGQAVLALIPHPGPTARYVLETVAGIAMLLAGAYLWRNRSRLAKKEMPTPPRQSKSSFVLGASISAVELPTAFPYFAAVVAVVGSGLDLSSQLILILLYNVCFVLPLLLIVLVLTFAPDRAQQLLAGTREWLRQHWPVLLAVLALVAGVFVTLLGVTGLGSNQKGSVGSVSRRVRKVISH